MAEGGPVFRLIGPRGAEGPLEGSAWSPKVLATQDGTVMLLPLLRIRFPLLPHVICCGFTEV